MLETKNAFETMDDVFMYEYFTSFSDKITKTNVVTSDKVQGMYMTARL